MDTPTPAPRQRENVLAPLTCPGCKRPLDERGRCWRCCYRVCSRCGQGTGSAFLVLCLACDLGPGAIHE